MNKLHKIVLILIIIILCIMIPNFVNAASALETFVKSSDFGSVTSAPNDELNGVQKATLETNIGTYLQSAQQLNSANNPKGAKEFLENQYNTLMQDYSNCPKTCKFIGYKLGNAWKTYDTAIKDSNNTNAADEFDKIYKEYTSLSAKDKKDNNKITDIKNRLYAQYNRLSGQEQTSRTAKMNEVYNAAVSTETTIKDKADNGDYKNKDKTNGDGQVGQLGESSASPNHTVDEIVEEAQEFINIGKKSNKTTLNGWNIREGSNTIYKILLSVGIVIATAVGAYLGLKFIMSSAEDKAQVKEALIPYIIGCIVIFGAFIIWQLAINLFGSVDKVAKNGYNIKYSIVQQTQINDDFNIFS